MNFTKEQTDELTKTLHSAINGIVRQQCAFVLVFTPVDRAGTVCTTNVEVSDALDLDNNLVGELQRWKIAASAPMTLHWPKRHGGTAAPRRRRRRRDGRR